MTDAPPLVDPAGIEEIADRVHVIPDKRIEFVPNVGIIVGDRATLVVETAMGARNGQVLLDAARSLGRAGKLLLTTTHFHPEHAFGAKPFEAEATYLANAAQAAELAEKGHEYVEMFSGFGPGLAQLLDGVELIPPDITYDGRLGIDLGGLAVELVEIGRAHTRGDQVVFLPEQRIVFAGDLVEDRFLPIFPDADAKVGLWLTALQKIAALRPAIVVGGHGAVGGPELIDRVREYLLAIQSRVSELADQGSDLEEIERELQDELVARYSDWGNHFWIKSAIDSFHAELAG